MCPNSRPKEPLPHCYYREPVKVHIMSDPGHAWASVTINDLAQVGLSPSDFSPYSYRRGDVCALEEDCDLPIYLRALRRHHIPIDVRTYTTNKPAPCRKWSPINVL